MTDDRYEYVGQPKHRAIVGSTDQTVWGKAAEHRAHVLRLLQRPANQRKGIIGVFGVGDGTALDLQGLLNRFHEVHLITMDAAKTKEIIQQQKVDDRQRIFTTVVDVSGVDDLLDEYQANPSDEKFDALMERIYSNPAIKGLAKFDIALSVSQIPKLTIRAAHCVGDDSDKLFKIITGTKRRHIQTLLEHVNRPGAAIFVIDIVSSETVPPLAQSPKNLPEILNQALRQGNFYAGGLPIAFDTSVQEFAHRFDDCNVAKTWLRQTENEHIACCAWRIVLNEKQGNENGW